MHVPLRANDSVVATMKANAASVYMNLQKFLRSMIWLSKDCLTEFVQAFITQLTYAIVYAMGHGGSVIGSVPCVHSYMPVELRRVNSDTVFMVCRERFWVVADLKRRYRNGLNEWMKMCLHSKSLWWGLARSGALVESKPFDQKVVGSNPAIAAT